jgi:uncharacterized protein YndB with AHSA1/START domain
MIRALAALALVFAAGAARAEVVSAGGDAFVVRNTVEVAAPPARVYAALGEVGRWWDKGHSWSGDSANLTLELRAGGCFCERLPGGGAEHMRVVMARPGALLRLAGALGPLQGEGVSGALTFELKPKGAATEVVQTYTVRGFSEAEAKQWAAPVDGVIRTQLHRFERYVETGRP